MPSAATTSPPAPPRQNPVKTVNPRHPRHPRYLVPSIIITAMLLGQVAVSVYSVPHKMQGRQHTHQTWPFLDYPMYAYASGPPVETTIVTMTAVLNDGAMINVSKEFMGFSWFTWRWRVIERLVASRVDDDPEKAELAALVEQHRAEALEKVLTQIAKFSDSPLAELRVDEVLFRVEGSRLVETQGSKSIDFSAIGGVTQDQPIDPEIIEVQRDE